MQTIIIVITKDLQIHGPPQMAYTNRYCYISTYYIKIICVATIH